ncbi:aminotransferase class V-fold PLP-dependent enzyme [Algoriphagus aestuarii]|nr:aminotransferase class V-fold PLP-dependent enzyme [Algoriphagus aestuarii]
MSSRRNFLQKLSIGALVPGVFGLQTEGSEFKIDHSIHGDSFWDQVRAQFPLTKDRIYFNNGTFGPSPTPVLSAIKNSLDETNTIGEYGHINPLRGELAAFVGIKESEISLTHNTTEGINIMAWGVPLSAGDEVIVTYHEHVGNALPWLNRAKLDKIVLVPFEPAATQAENLDLIKKLVTPRTKVIAIPHITCTTGLVFPIKEIADFAKSKGIFTAIDGAHGAGTLDLNLHDLGVDFYASSYHKWMLGPNGSGFLYVKEEQLDRLQAYQVGAYSDVGFDLKSSPPLLKGYVNTAHRYDYGSQSLPLIKGVIAAIGFHQEIGKEKIEARVRELNQYLFEGLDEMNQVLEIKSAKEADSRLCMVTFKPKKMDNEVAYKAIGKGGFRLRIVPEAGLNAIRVSTHIYNSKSEIDTFLNQVQKVLG